jgi:hypothetical protein
LTGNIYEYLASLLIVSVIFITATYALPNIGYVSILAVDQQQLRNAATQAFNTMLLETGYPTSWGTIINADYQFDSDSVTRFGLASAEDSSFYVLDSEKIQRLVAGDAIGSISYNQVRSLLELEEYGFCLKIIPPFNVTLLKDEFTLSSSQINLDFDVKVLYNDGRPIAGALVDATIIYMTKEGGNTAKFYATVEKGSTDSIGLCYFDKTIDALSGETMTSAIIAFKVTVADLSSIVLTYQSTPPNNVADISVVGDEVILSIPDQPPSPPNNARWVDFIVVFDGESFSFIHNGTRSNDDKLNYGGGSPFKIWNKNFPGLHYQDKVFLLFSFWTVLSGGGRTSVLIAGPNPAWQGNRLLQYGDTNGPKNAGSAITLQRTVSIAGMTYLAELTFWKE